MNKQDFVAVVTVMNCNPNGDPLNEGRPRTNLEGYGEISAECCKRKIRNRLQDMGRNIFVQSDSRIDDGIRSLSERAKALPGLNDALMTDVDSAKEIACAAWEDVRLFGQLFAFKGGISVGIRGAVTICHARSVNPVDIKDIQITKSTNGEPNKKKKESGEEYDHMSSDRMGNKALVEKGVYVIKGSVNPHYSEKNGVSKEDIKDLQKALATLFENDESSARPSGSMDVKQVYWFTQDENDYISTAKVFDLVSVDNDGNATVKELPAGVEMELLL